MFDATTEAEAAAVRSANNNKRPTVEEPNNNQQSKSLVERQQTRTVAAVPAAERVHEIVKEINAPIQGMNASTVSLVLSSGIDKALLFLQPAKYVGKRKLPSLREMFPNYWENIDPRQLVPHFLTNKDGTLFKNPDGYPVFTVKFLKMEQVVALETKYGSAMFISKEVAAAPEAKVVLAPCYVNGSTRVIGNMPFEMLPQHAREFLEKYRPKGFVAHEFPAKTYAEAAGHLIVSTRAYPFKNDDDRNTESAETKACFEWMEYVSMRIAFIVALYGLMYTEILVEVAYNTALEDRDFTGTESYTKLADQLKPLKKKTGAENEAAIQMLKNRIGFMYITTGDVVDRTASVFAEFARVGSSCVFKAKETKDGDFEPESKIVNAAGEEVMASLISLNIRLFKRGTYKVKDVADNAPLTLEQVIANMPRSLRNAYALVGFTPTQETVDIINRARASEKLKDHVLGPNFPPVHLLVKKEPAEYENDIREAERKMSGQHVSRNKFAPLSYEEAEINEIKGACAIPIVTFGCRQGVVNKEAKMNGCKINLAETILVGASKLKKEGAESSIVKKTEAPDCDLDETFGGEAPVFDYAGSKSVVAATAVASAVAAAVTNAPALDTLSQLATSEPPAIDGGAVAVGAIGGGDAGDEDQFV